MHFSPKQKCSWYLRKTDALFWQSIFLQLYIFCNFFFAKNCYRLLVHCIVKASPLPCLMFMLLFLLSCLIFLCPVTNCLVWLISLDSCNKRGVWAKCSFCLIVKTQGARRRGSSQTIGSKLNVQTFNSPIFHVMSPPTVSLCTLRSWYLGFTSYYSFKVFHSRNDLFCLFTARLHRPLCAIGDRGKI